ncbi:right-handed parallel beta-helix repeat-containing protein [Streptomyces sp. NPDC032161]|uniref:right-handed parallel beta-helix repeat-containing protein n=1 Tax=unclassified Streptomyces TaxID=2593676 RepID=UPI0034069309
MKRRPPHVVRGTAATATAALLTALLAAPTALAAPGARTLYAAPDGNGTACTAARPCTLEGARDRARTETGRDVRVLLKDGTYRLTEPLRLGAADSGKNGHTVTWTAAPGARPVLSGGRDITGWRPGADGTWTADVPAGVTPRQLFVDGERAVRARGEACPASVCDATADGMTGATATGIDRWRRPTDAEAVVRIRWRDYHCRITGVDGDTLSFARPCWTNASSGTDRTGPSWDTTTVDSARYTGVAFFENARELLDDPGEFVWDSRARTVTYLPRAGEDMRRARTVTPHTERLLLIEGAHDITVSGIGFAYAAYHQPGTDEGYAGTQAGLTLTGATGPVDHAGRFYTKPAAAVTVRGGRHIRLDDTRFARLGGAGAILEAGTKDSSLTRSSFSDLSSGAVYVGDTEPLPGAALAGERNTVARNTITRTGVEYTDSVGVWAGYEAGLTVDHNTLEHLPYSGISVGWGWNQPEAQKSVLRDNKVTNNRITDVMEVDKAQHDGGAIYTQGAQPGTVVSGNYINRSAFGNTERDGNGVYLDEQSSHILVERNVITRVGYKWVSNWADYGIHNTVRGNWTDTAAPPLGGEGSVMTDNRTGLDRLPAEAVSVAARAGARGGPVERLRTDLARAGTATQSSTEGTAVAALALDGDTTTDTRTLSEAGARWEVDLGARKHIRRIEIWNDSSSTTGDFDVVTDDATVHVGGKASRPTVLDLDSRTRTVRIVASGTGRVGLSQVLVHP